MLKKIGLVVAGVVVGVVAVIAFGRVAPARAAESCPKGWRVVATDGHPQAPAVVPVGAGTPFAVIPTPMGFKIISRTCHY
jgi:hypothetical protein